MWRMHGGWSKSVGVGQHVALEKVERSWQLRRRMTPAEGTLWSALRDGQVDGFRFRRQQVIDGFIVDFYCSAASLVIEVDGSVHAQQAEYDAERDVVIRARQLRILRFTNDDVRYNIAGVLFRIRAAIRAAHKSPLPDEAADYEPPLSGTERGRG
jgi:very-short-patch-repair endonuclease